MNAETSQHETVEPPAPRTRRLLRIIRHLGADMTVALVWAALVVAIVLFSGAVSQFAYVDF